MISGRSDYNIGSLQITLKNIGEVYDKLGQHADALKSYQQALDIFKQLGYKEEEGITLNSIGAIYTRLGHYPDALRFNRQALDVFKQVNSKAGEGTTLNNIGEVYTRLGQYPDALKFHQQALDIFNRLGKKAKKRSFFHSVSIILNAAAVAAGNSTLPGSPSNGLNPATFEFDKVLYKVEKGIALNGIGAVYTRSGQYANALQFYQQALDVFKQLGYKAGEGITLSNTGAVYTRSGQYANALKFYQQALDIFNQSGNKAESGITLNTIGSIYFVLGQYPDAEKKLTAAVQVLESLRSGLTDASKVSIFETQSNTYRLLQQTLIAQKKVDTALEVAEQGRARAFVELLATRSPLQHETQLTSAPLTIQQIQQVAKAQNATLIEYSVPYNNTSRVQGKGIWNPALYIWVIKPTGQVTFRTINLQPLLKQQRQERVTAADSLDNLVGSILKTSPRNWSQPLKQLHQVLIQPIADLLPTDPNARVVFIPQGSLFKVPFVALQDVSGKYLIEKHTIVTAPSIQVLELTRQQQEKVKKAKLKDALVLGNPTMPIVSLKIGEPPQQLDSLPGSEQEAKAIAPLFNTQAIIGNKATKAAVLQQLPSSRLIHLATHGLADDVRGLGSWIALAPSGQDNGLLTAEEILNLKLNAELVVMSACETGRGRITGDGIIGLSRAWISAGIPSVVVSLWKVPDDATNLLMTKFYQNMQRNPDKAFALRNAILTTMKQHPQPRSWGAFTLIGEAN